MESYLGNSRAYYEQGLPPVTDDGSTPASYSGTTSGHIPFPRGTPVPAHQAPSTHSGLPSSSLPSSRQHTGPSRSNHVPVPAYHQYGGEVPYSQHSSRQFTTPKQSSTQYLMGHSSLQHASSYTPPHSRPPDHGYISRPLSSRSLEVTRVGPAHTFSSISPPESAQIITSRPNTTRTMVTNSIAADYRYLDQHQPSSHGITRNSSSSSGRSLPGVKSSNQYTHPPTLIKAEEPTTLSAAHQQLQHSIQQHSNKDKRFETATAPVPYAVAKRAEDPFFNDRLEESYACIKKVENPYAISNIANDSAASSSQSSAGEVEIKKQRNEGYSSQYCLSSAAITKREFLEMNGSRENWPYSNAMHLQAAKDSRKKYIDSKSDLVLDLSVKTVKQSADSTAPELEATTPTPAASQQSSYCGSASATRSSPFNFYPKEKVASSSIYRSDNEECKIYGYTDRQKITPNCGKYLAQDINGMPCSSRYSPNVTTKRPAESQWDPVPSNKISKIDSPISRSKSPYSMGVSQYKHSSSLDPGRGMQSASPVSRKEIFHVPYSGMNDRKTYEAVGQTDPYKSWSYADKSKISFLQTSQIKQENYHQPLADAASEVISGGKLLRPDIRYHYQNVCQAAGSTNNYNLPTSHYSNYPNQYTSHKSLQSGNSVKEKNSVTDCNSYTSQSSGAEVRKREVVDARQDSKSSYYRGQGSGPSEPYKEIRVKTETEINNSCLPSSSLSSESGSVFTSQDAKYTSSLPWKCHDNRYPNIQSNIYDCGIASLKNIKPNLVSTSHLNTGAEKLQSAIPSGYGTGVPDRLYPTVTAPIVERHTLAYSCANTTNTYTYPQPYNASSIGASAAERFCNPDSSNQTAIEIGKKVLGTYDLVSDNTKDPNVSTHYSSDVMIKEHSLPGNLKAPIQSKPSAQGETTEKSSSPWQGSAAETVDMTLKGSKVEEVQTGIFDRQKRLKEGEAVSTTVTSSETLENVVSSNGDERESAKRSRVCGPVDILSEKRNKVMAADRQPSAVSGNCSSVEGTGFTVEEDTDNNMAPIVPDIANNSEERHTEMEFHTKMCDQTTSNSDSSFKESDMSSDKVDSSFKESDPSSGMPESSPDLKISKMTDRVSQISTADQSRSPSDIAVEKKSKDETVEVSKSSVIENLSCSTETNIENTALRKMGEKNMPEMVNAANSFPCDKELRPKCPDIQDNSTERENSVKIAGGIHSSPDSQLGFSDIKNSKSKCNENLINGVSDVTRSDAERNKISNKSNRSCSSDAGVSTVSERPEDTEDRESVARQDSQGQNGDKQQHCLNSLNLKDTKDNAEQNNEQEVSPSAPGEKGKIDTSFKPDIQGNSSVHATELSSVSQWKSSTVLNNAEKLDASQESQVNEEKRNENEDCKEIKRTMEEQDHVDIKKTVNEEACKEVKKSYKGEEPGEVKKTVNEEACKEVKKSYNGEEHDEVKKIVDEDTCKEVKKRCKGEEHDEVKKTINEEACKEVKKSYKGEEPEEVKKTVDEGACKELKKHCKGEENDEVKKTVDEGACKELKKRCKGEENDEVKKTVDEEACKEVKKRCKGEEPDKVKKTVDEEACKEVKKTSEEKEESREIKGAFENQENKAVKRAAGEPECKEVTLTFKEQECNKIKRTAEEQERNNIKRAVEEQTCNEIKKTYDKQEYTEAKRSLEELDSEVVRSTSEKLECIEKQRTNEELDHEEVNVVAEQGINKNKKTKSDEHKQNKDILQGDLRDCKEIKITREEQIQKKLDELKEQELKKPMKEQNDGQQKTENDTEQMESVQRDEKIEVKSAANEVKGKSGCQNIIPGNETGIENKLSESQDDKDRNQHMLQNPDKQVLTHDVEEEPPLKSQNQKKMNIRPADTKENVSKILNKVADRKDDGVESSEHESNQRHSDITRKNSPNIFKQRLLTGIERGLELETKPKMECNASVIHKAIQEDDISTKVCDDSSKRDRTDISAGKAENKEHSLLAGILGTETQNKQSRLPNEVVVPEDLSVIPTNNVNMTQEEKVLDFARDKPADLRIESKQSEALKYAVKSVNSGHPINSMPSPWQSAAPYSIPHNYPPHAFPHDPLRQSPISSHCTSDTSSTDCATNQSPTSSVPQHSKGDSQPKSHLPPPHSHPDHYLSSRSPFASRPHSVPSFNSHVNPPPSHSAPLHAAQVTKSSTLGSSAAPKSVGPSLQPPPPPSHLDPPKHPPSTVYRSYQQPMQSSYSAPAVHPVITVASHQYGSSVPPRTLLSPHSPTHPPPPPDPGAQHSYSHSYQGSATLSAAPHGQHNSMTVKPTYTQSNSYQSSPCSISSHKTCSVPVSQSVQQCSKSGQDKTASNKYPSHTTHSYQHDSNLYHSYQSQYSYSQNPYISQYPAGYSSHDHYKSPQSLPARETASACNPPVSKAGPYGQSTELSATESAQSYTQLPSHLASVNSQYPPQNYSSHVPSTTQSYPSSHIPQTSAPVLTKCYPYSQSYQSYPPSTYSSLSQPPSTSVSYQSSKCNLNYPSPASKSQQSSSYPSNTLPLSSEYPSAANPSSYIPSNQSQVPGYESKTQFHSQPPTTHSYHGYTYPSGQCAEQYPQSYSQPCSQTPATHSYPSTQSLAHPIQASSLTSSPSMRNTAVSPRGSRSVTPHSNSQSPCSSRNTSPHSSRHPSPAFREVSHMPTTPTTRDPCHQTGFSRSSKDTISVQNFKNSSPVSCETSHPKVYVSPASYDPHSRKSPGHHPPLNLSSHPYPSCPTSRSSTSTFQVPSQPPPHAAKPQTSAVMPSSVPSPLSGSSNAYYRQQTASYSPYSPSQTYGAVPPAHSKIKPGLAKSQDYGSQYQNEMDLQKKAEYPYRPSSSGNSGNTSLPATGLPVPPVKYQGQQYQSSVPAHHTRHPTPYQLNQQYPSTTQAPTLSDHSGQSNTSHIRHSTSSNFRHPTPSNHPYYAPQNSGKIPPQAVCYSQLHSNQFSAGDSSKHAPPTDYSPHPSNQCPSPQASRPSYPSQHQHPSKSLAASPEQQHQHKVVKSTTPVSSYVDQSHSSPYTPQYSNKITAPAHHAPYPAHHYSDYSSYAYNYPPSQAHMGSGPGYVQGSTVPSVSSGYFSQPPAHSNSSKTSQPVAAAVAPCQTKVGPVVQPNIPPSQSASQAAPSYSLCLNQQSPYSNHSLSYTSPSSSVYSKYPDHQHHNQTFSVKSLNNPPSGLAEPSTSAIPHYTAQGSLSNQHSSLPKPAHSNSMIKLSSQPHSLKMAHIPNTSVTKLDYNSDKQNSITDMKPNLSSSDCLLKNESAHFQTSSSMTVQKVASQYSTVTVSGNHGNTSNESTLSKPSDSDGCTVIAKLQKKLTKKGSFDKGEVEELKEQDKSIETEKDDLDQKFLKLLDDLAAHPETVLSKKSCILSRRYNQKMQMLHAIENNEEWLPIPYAEEEEEEDLESEREEPVKKFRGKFRSIKDRAVERVILTYASHSDESATEMIPDDDASDFEEELIKEIEAKARKGRSKECSLREIRKRGSSVDRKHMTKSRREIPDKRRLAKKGEDVEDKDFTPGSSDEGSTSSVSRESSSSDESNSELGSDSSFSSDVGNVNCRKKSTTRRSAKSNLNSSDSDEEFMPRRKTRRRQKSSSDEDSNDMIRSKLKRTTSESPDNKRLPVGKKRKFSKDGMQPSMKGFHGRKKDRLDSDTDDEPVDQMKIGANKLKVKRIRQVTSSESEDERMSKSCQRQRQGKVDENRQATSDSDTAVNNRKKKLMEKSNFVSDSENKENINEGLKEPDKVIDEDAEKKEILDEGATERQEPDSVILKLTDERQKELSREDVIEMKNWQQKASLEMEKFLNELPEMRLRHSWKKPEFGDEFRKGWQHEYKKYKLEVARTPKKLVSSPTSPTVSASASQGSDKGSPLKKGKDLKKSSKGRSNWSPSAKNTRSSRAGIIKTSMAVAERNELKVAARPEISGVMQRFFEKVVGDPVLLEPKKFQAFASYTPPHTRTGLTPTPSVAPSMMASDDSDRDSLASLRTDLPASDSVPVARKSSIANSLIKKLKKKYNAKKMDTQWLNKSRGILEATNKPQLIPTPGLSASSDLVSSSYDSFRMTTFFRKDSVNRYRENFDDIITKIKVGESVPLLVPSRTRKKSKAILTATMVKAVFGEDLPSLKSESSTKDTPQAKMKKKVVSSQDPRRKDLLVHPARDSPIPSSISLSSTPTEFLYNDDYDSELRSERSESALRELAIMQDIKKSGRRLRKYRKFRSGFDYIRKKKKAKTEEESIHAAKRKIPVRKRVSWPEESRDVANEVRSWVINKGLGETVLHKAARLQYHDVVIYCLESSDFNVNAKDNAGYTPLHEACNRGHLDIAQALCAHRAHVNAAGYGGMRPLHEAMENGHIELARLLLAYGADSSLSTYGGQSCLALASDPQVEKFLKDYLADLRGIKADPWSVSGPYRLLDIKAQGTNIFDSSPSVYVCSTSVKSENDDSATSPLSTNNNIAGSTNFDVDCAKKLFRVRDRISEEDITLSEIVFECSAKMIPNIYDVTGKPGRYVLLKELLECLSLSKKELIMLAGTIETLHLSQEEFEMKAKSQIIGYEVAHSQRVRGQVTLVKYTARVKDLFDVEYTYIS